MRIYSCLKVDPSLWLRLEFHFETKYKFLLTCIILFKVYLITLLTNCHLFKQIENEYNNVQLAYREFGKKYVEWAANMATSLYNGVPWIMCKQKEAPPSIVSQLVFFLLNKQYYIPC